MEISSNIDVDRTRLISHLQKIIGCRCPSRGWRHLAKVETFIIAEFTSYGLDVTTDSFYYYGEIYHSIVARLGDPRNDPLIILGAHFDTVKGSPGADANGSGVAVLLESARLLSQLKLETPMLFCAFNLKEEKMIGSRTFAPKLKTSGKKVAAMVSLEAVGYTDSRPNSQKFPQGLDRLYPDRGDFIGVVGDWESNALLDNFAAGMRQVSNLDVETLWVHDKGVYMPGVRMERSRAVLGFGISRVDGYRHLYLSQSSLPP